MKLIYKLTLLTGLCASLVSVNETAHANLPTEKLADKIKTVELPAPQIAWLNWDRFNKIYVDKLSKSSTTDEERLAIVKRAGAALNQHLMALTPDQLHRVIESFTKEDARLEALQELAASTRYNTSDIPKITSAFNELKDDAHGMLFAIGGYGGY